MIIQPVATTPLPPGARPTPSTRARSVWADSSAFTPFSSTGSNQFLMRASGGVGIGTASPGAPLDVLGLMQVRSNGSIRSIPATYGGSFNGMIESYYGDSDRYGLAQLPGGITALYTASSFGSSSIQFGQMTGASNFSPQMTINHAGDVAMVGGATIAGTTTTGRLGVGSGVPTATDILHAKSAVSMRVLAEASNGHAGYVSKNSLREWFMGVNVGSADWVVIDNTAGGTRLQIDTSGAVFAQSFTPTSDRNAKENFVSVNPRETLEKVAALPITRWNFKEDTATPHLGPVAQDFHAAFGLGKDDKGIATVDADGVALAAIQGLNLKLEEALKTARAGQNKQIGELKSENAELKQRLEKLEQLIAHKLNGGAL